jgi:hypothetical protein
MGKATKRNRHQNISREKRRNTRKLLIDGGAKRVSFQYIKYPVYFSTEKSGGRLFIKDPLCDDFHEKTHIDRLTEEIGFTYDSTENAWKINDTNGKIYNMDEPLRDYGAVLISELNAIGGKECKYITRSPHPTTKSIHIYPPEYNIEHDTIIATAGLMKKYGVDSKYNIVGLSNPGVACYYASILQVLYRTHEFRYMVRYFNDESDETINGNRYLKHIKQLFNDMDGVESKDGYGICRFMKDKSVDYFGPLSMNERDSSTEVYRSILQSLYNKTKKSICKGLKERFVDTNSIYMTFPLETSDAGAEFNSYVTNVEYEAMPKMMRNDYNIGFEVDLQITRSCRDDTSKALYYNQMPQMIDIDYFKECSPTSLDNITKVLQDQNELGADSTATDSSLPIIYKNTFEGCIKVDAEGAPKGFLTHDTYRFIKLSEIVCLNFNRYYDEPNSEKTYIAEESHTFEASRVIKALGNRFDHESVDLIKSMILDTGINDIEQWEDEDIVSNVVYWKLLLLTATKDENKVKVYVANIDRADKSIPNLIMAFFKSDEEDKEHDTSANTTSINTKFQNVRRKKCVTTINIPSNMTIVIKTKTGSVSYDLYAIVSHSGDGTHGGHWTSFVKGPVDDKWRWYNDSVVTDINDIENVSNFNTGVSGSATIDMMFYRKSESQVPLVEGTSDSESQVPPKKVDTPPKKTVKNPSKPFMCNAGETKFTYGGIEVEFKQFAERYGIKLRPPKKPLTSEPE